MTNISPCSVQVKREVGDISILVNNAGIVTGKKFMEAPDSLIEKTVEVNTMAHFWVSQTQQTCGSICFVSWRLHLREHADLQTGYLIL